MDKEKERRENQQLQREHFRSFVSGFVKSRRRQTRLKRENWPVRALRMEPANQEGLEGQSGKVVLSAIAINSVNCLGKFVAWGYSGSHAIFSEAIHSLADTLNQVILAYGINKSVKGPSEAHPYGYSNMQYVSALISGVGIFCLGSGLSIYHGIAGLTTPSEMESFNIAFFVLGSPITAIAHEQYSNG